jgi:hypothetical protein
MLSFHFHPKTKRRRSLLAPEQPLGDSGKMSVDEPVTYSGKPGTKPP